MILKDFMTHVLGIATQMALIKISETAASGLHAVLREQCGQDGTCSKYLKRTGGTL
jgi:hypothetical protein